MHNPEAMIRAGRKHYKSRRARFSQTQRLLYRRTRRAWALTKDENGPSFFNIIEHGLSGIPTHSRVRNQQRRSNRHVEV